MANPDEMRRSDPWQMRVSDADREKYVSVLQDAYAEGRLRHDEYDERMSQAYQSVTFADLYPLLLDLPVDESDLPMPPGAQHQQVAQLPAPGTELSPRSVIVDASPAVAVFSEVRRGGRWVVPTEQTSVAVMGTLKLDLREALLESGSVTIQAVAVMGEIRIKVPDDVQLEVTGTGVFGEFIRKDKRSSDRRIDAPVGSARVHITGAAIFGSVNVVVVPAHEGQGIRVAPQTTGQIGPPPTTFPPAILPPPGAPPPVQPQAGQPSTFPPPVKQSAADKGLAREPGDPPVSNDLHASSQAATTGQEVQPQQVQPPALPKDSDLSGASEPPEPPKLPESPKPPGTGDQGG